MKAVIAYAEEALPNPVEDDETDVDEDNILNDDVFDDDSNNSVKSTVVDDCCEWSDDCVGIGELNKTGALSIKVNQSAVGNNEVDENGEVNGCAVTCNEISKDDDGIYLYIYVNMCGIFRHMNVLIVYVYHI
jgi:hypothetical protein